MKKRSSNEEGNKPHEQCMDTIFNSIKKRGKDMDKIIKYNKIKHKAISASYSTLFKNKMAYIYFFTTFSLTFTQKH